MGQAWYKDYLGTVLPSTGACIMLDKLDLSSMSRMMLDRLGTSSIRARTSSMASIGGSHMYIRSELEALTARVQLISYRYILL